MDIEMTKEIIDNQIHNNKIFSFGKSFDEYQKVYAFTNENINGYMNNFIFNKDNSVLSVLASGDHIFNLIYYGVINIDTFDVNRLTEYYFYLKLAMINSLSYNEFINFIDRVYNNDIEYENDMLLYIIRNIDIKYRKYYEEIIMYSNNSQKNNNNKLSLLKMLLINTNNDYKYKNTYLLNEENYNKTKENIPNLNFRFSCKSCFNIKDIYNKKYNYIFLSNIIDYFYQQYGYFWDYKYLEEYYNYLDNILSDKSVVLLDYLWNCYIIRNNTIKKNIITSSSVTIDDLINEEIITFSHINKDGAISNSVKDGLILRRKK